ncbi:hypothetical protein M8J76_003412 [Diaphorina citri]|nr:hypothetical protein M8J76_003412 [Diaphorina citri]
MFALLFGCIQTEGAFLLPCLFAVFSFVLPSGALPASRFLCGTFCRDVPEAETPTTNGELSVITDSRGRPTNVEATFGDELIASYISRFISPCMFEVSTKTKSTSSY